MCLFKGLFKKQTTGKTPFLSFTQNTMELFMTGILAFIVFSYHQVYLKYF